MRVQTLCPELAIVAFDEGVVCWLDRSREVQNDILLIGPQIQIARGKLRSLIDTDRFWIARFLTYLFEGLNPVFATIAEPGIGGGREPIGRFAAQRFQRSLGLELRVMLLPLRYF